MIIYLSPAKTLKTIVSGKEDNDLLREKRLLLLEAIQQLDVKELQKRYKCSEKIAKDAYIGFSNPLNMGEAIRVFSGPAFKALDYESLTNKQRANESLLIGDAYYGLIEPLTQIHHYRLDFSMNSKLLSFWKDSVNEVLKKKLIHKSVLIDLSSEEYSQLLDPESLSITIIRPTFLNSGKLVSFHAKRARGLMARFLIENPQKKVEDFNLEGYLHVGNYVFTKD